MNEDTHRRENDAREQEVLIARINQARLNSKEWLRRAEVAMRMGDTGLAHNLITQAAEEIQRHGH